MSEKLVQIKVEDILKLLDAPFNNDRDRLLIYLLFETGGRISEVLGFKWENIDWEHNRVWGEVKKKRKRTYDWFYYGLRSKQLLAKSPGEKGRIFDITRRYADYLVKHYCEKVGIKPISCHKLRHAFAIQWAQKHKDAEALRRILHHSRLDTTQVYFRFVGDEFVEEEYNR